MRKVVWLAAGVLILQLGFILSYVAAFHQPTPREIPIAVVAAQGLPAGLDVDTADKLNAIEGTPLDARTAASTGDARALIRNREVLGAYVLSPTGTDTLITASAAGSSIATSLDAIFTKIDKSQNRTFVVRDDIPVGIHDNRGLSGFYLSVGWVVGGYLLAAAIGLLIGAPKSLREASVQLAVLVGYSILSGIFGAFITTHVLGTFAGHWFPLSLLGTAVVLATALFTLGLRAAVGVAAVPIAIVVFVILGNPSAGGAFGPNVLPEFYSAVGRWITPGVGTEGVRSIVYFAGNGVGQPALALVLYTVVGLALFFGFTYRTQQKPANLPVHA